MAVSVATRVAIRVVRQDTVGGADRTADSSSKLKESPKETGA